MEISSTGWPRIRGEELRDVTSLAAAPARPERDYLNHSTKVEIGEYEFFSPLARGKLEIFASYVFVAVRTDRFPLAWHDGVHWRPAGKRVSVLGLFIDEPLLRGTM
jgi:hypothetical protein